MAPDEKSIFLKDSLRRNHEWIRSADQKISIFLAFQGVIAGLILPKTIPWIFNGSSAIAETSLATALIGIICILFSVLKSISSIMPRLNNAPANSLIYFGDIAKLSRSDFSDRLNKMTEKEYQGDLIGQIHVCSIIAHNKHKDFRHAITLFIAGVMIIGLGYWTTWSNALGC